MCGRGLMSPFVSWKHDYTPSIRQGVFESSIVYTVCLLASLLRLFFVLLISFLSLLACAAPCKISHYVGFGAGRALIFRCFFDNDRRAPASTLRLFCYCILRC